jgi:YfiH family protein
LNLNFGSNDNKENVMENLTRISELGFPIEKMVFSGQVHDACVKVVSAEDCNKISISDRKFLSGYDGIMTNEPGIVLVTFYADCVPLYFFDPVENVIALSHSGWRGTVAEIAKVTINEMSFKFGSLPENILVGIGPSICQDCFEVGNEVADIFLDKFEYSAKFIKNSLIDPEKKHINLWEINKQILIDAGVLACNIELPDLCTKCNPDVFFSHRAMGSKRGGMAAFLSLC